MFLGCSILNPKRTRRDRYGTAGWYPYYAGFSGTFASALLSSAEIGSNTVVLDPWNGSGTTTSAASALGFPTVGYDLNPVMAIVARARLLSSKRYASILPLCASAVKRARRVLKRQDVSDDGLTTWMVPSSAQAFRALERAAYSMIAGEDLDCGQGADPTAILEASVPAAFLYTALFRSIRGLLLRFYASNPTWIKMPKNPASRIRPMADTVFQAFRREAAFMTAVAGQADPVTTDGPEAAPVIRVASSRSLPLGDGTVGFVLSSPPYCTRIDYAVSTMPELTVLGLSPSNGIARIRDEMIGTSTIAASVPNVNARWGPACNAFLRALSSHASKASCSYYLKNHLQYFDGVFSSLREISRVLKPDGGCVLVVQDSYYKDVHNDLPRILTEMAEASGLDLEHRMDFPVGRTFAGINPTVRRYRKDSRAVESSLCLRKQ